MFKKYTITLFCIIFLVNCGGSNPSTKTKGSQSGAYGKAKLKNLSDICKKTNGVFDTSISEHDFDDNNGTQTLYLVYCNLNSFATQVIKDKWRDVCMSGGRLKSTTFYDDSMECTWYSNTN